jgi:hypothetical protein
VWIRHLARAAWGVAALFGGLASLGGAYASSGETNLQATQNLFWILVAMSVVGAIITWGFMAYALWKFRDPKVKGRRYG